MATTNKLAEFLPSGLAAARPVAPGTGVYLYYATDTGAVSIWDGAAWRAVSGSSSPTTTRGDLIIRGASADQRLAIGAAARVLRSDGTDPAWAALLAADVSDGGAVGRSVLQSATAADAATAQGLLWTPSLASSSGWTDVSSGVGSVAITGGALTGTITGSVAPVNIAAATIPWGGSDCFDVRARVQITGSTGADAKANLRVRYGSDGFTIVPSGDGGLALIRTLGGYGSLASTTGRPVDGTGWVRLRIVGQRVTFWYGTGVGSAEPTSWTLLYDADQGALVGAASPTVLYLGGQNDSGAGLSGSTDFIWRAVTVRSLAGPV